MKGDGGEVTGSRLRRDLGLLDAVGIGFGAIVGAGIFVVTGVAAGIAGPSFLLGLFVAGIAATANALSSAQLAAEYPHSGGTYEYGYRVLHPWAGFVAGWMFLASKIAAAGTVALGLAGYLDGLLPGLNPRIIAVSAVLLFTMLNWFGVRRSSRANLFIVLISLGTLIVFAIATFGSFSADNLRPFAPAGWRGVLQSSAILFFAYTGYARIATLGEEVREPRVTIPRAVLITVGGAIVLYFAVSLAAVGAAGADALADTAAPLRIAAQRSGHDWLAIVISIGGLTAMLGVILSQVLGLSRMVFAMARRKDLPAGLDHVHARHGTPDRAVLLVGASAAIVAATGTLAGIAAAASFTILVYYGIANVAALRMPRSGKLYPDAVPIVGAVACAALAVSLPARTMVSGVIVLLVGVALRLASRGLRPQARGPGTTFPE
ncbi:MAG TPA: amino acid permease [Longimicrobiales bacterium]